MQRRHVEGFFGERNAATRIDLFDELNEAAQAALRSFFRRLGAPQLYDEVMIPLLNAGDSQVFAAVRDRPWPPWGLGARTVSAVCQAFLVAAGTYGLTPVFVTDEDASNIGLVAAVYKETVEYLALSVANASIHYSVAEGSTLGNHVLRKVGFERTDDVILSEKGRYYIYEISAEQLRHALKLDTVETLDLLAHRVPPEVLEINTLFHSTIYLASRAEWMLGQVSEIVFPALGVAGGKPGGVPTGTGSFVFDPADAEKIILVALENFLTQVENQELLDYVLGHEAEFSAATIIERGSETPVVNERVRRSKTLDRLERFESILSEQIKAYLVEVLRRLDYAPFPIGRIELQVTAGEDGDYFRMHHDSDEKSTREITFVYFFYREPRRFSGGELRVFETKMVDGRQIQTDQQRTLVPRQNVAVFFPSRHEHEVLPVRVPTKSFADSRFTITGWIHRA